MWTYLGVHVGCFRGNEVYSVDGYYLGEIKEGGRLITDKKKKGLRCEPYTHHPKRAAYVRHVDNCGFDMLPEHEDFTCPIL